MEYPEKHELYEVQQQLISRANIMLCRLAVCDSTEEGDKYYDDYKFLMDIVREIDKVKA